MDEEKWGCFWRIGKNVLSLHIVHAEMAGCRVGMIVVSSFN